MPTIKSIFTVKKNEWDTKEDAGNSSKCIVCTAVWQKALLRLKQHQTKNQVATLLFHVEWGKMAEYVCGHTNVCVHTNV